MIITCTHRASRDEIEFARPFESTYNLNDARIARNYNNNSSSICN